MPLIPFVVPPATNQEDMYLDYVNNFLTVLCFAEYYGISEDDARALINEQRIK